MIDITVEQFKKRLKQPNHPDGFHVAVDSQDKTQLYIAINDGLANIKCDPIELYGTDIKNCVAKRNIANCYVSLLIFLLCVPTQILSVKAY